MSFGTEIDEFVKAIAKVENKAVYSLPFLGTVTGQQGPVQEALEEVATELYLLQLRERRDLFVLFTRFQQ